MIELNGTEVKWEDEDQVDYAVRCELFESGLMEFAFNNWAPFTKPGTLTIEAQSKDLTMPSGAINQAHQQTFDVYTPP
jgi:hypothetical protein